MLRTSQMHLRSTQVLAVQTKADLSAIVTSLICSIERSCLNSFPTHYFIDAFLPSSFFSYLFPVCYSLNFKHSPIDPVVAVWFSVWHYWEMTDLGWGSISWLECSAGLHYLLHGQEVSERGDHIPQNTSHYALPLNPPKSRVSRAYWSQSRAFRSTSRNKHLLCDYPGICCPDGKLTNTLCHLLLRPRLYHFFLFLAQEDTQQQWWSGFFIFPPLYQEKQDLEHTSKISRAGQ